MESSSRGGPGSRLSLRTGVIRRRLIYPTRGGSRIFLTTSAFIGTAIAGGTERGAVGRRKLVAVKVRMLLRTHRAVSGAMMPSVIRSLARSVAVMTADGLLVVTRNGSERQMCLCFQPAMAVQTDKLTTVTLQ